MRGWRWREGLRRFLRVRDRTDALLLVVPGLGIAALVLDDHGWVPLALALAAGGAWLVGRVWRCSLVRRERKLMDRLERRHRSVVERLDSRMEPLTLARALGRVAREWSGAGGCVVGFTASGFPAALARDGDVPGDVDRAAFDTRLAEGGPGQVVRIGRAGETLAAVWLHASGSGRGRMSEPDRGLFVRAAGQLLENARLLSEVRQLAEKARAASDAKSEFLATMSHEIRTPLHGLLGMMDVLEQDERDPARLATLQTMRESGRRLKRILDGVLDLSRIEARGVDLDPAPFELPALLEHVVDLHAPNAHSAGLALRLRIDAGLPAAAVGDADRIAQLIGNLLSNAIKFTDAGAVELAARVDAAGRLVVDVSDTGPGVEAGLQESLFQPFTQLEAAMTRQHSGTGLGLAICRRLAEAMGGTVSLSSSPGRGSRFSVRLPLAGLAKQPPYRSRMLAGLRLAAALPAPDRRVLWRLARRWSLAWTPVERSPAPDVLVYRIGSVDGDSLRRLRSAGTWCVHLGAAPGDAHGGDARLDEPLTESRLVAALMNAPVSRRRAG